MISQVRLWLLEILCNCISGNLKMLPKSNIEDTEASYGTSYKKISIIFPFVLGTTAFKLS